MGIRNGGLFHQALAGKGGEFGRDGHGVGIQGIEHGDDGGGFIRMNAAKEGELEVGHKIKSFLLPANLSCPGFAGMAEALACGTATPANCVHRVIRTGPYSVFNVERPRRGPTEATATSPGPRTYGATRLPWRLRLGSDCAEITGHTDWGVHYRTD